MIWLNMANLQTQICIDTLQLLSDVQQQIHKVEDCKQESDIFGLQFPLRKLQDYYPVLQQLDASCSSNTLKTHFRLLLELLLPIIHECESLLRTTSAGTYAIHHEKKKIKSGEVGRPKISINVEEVLKMRATGMSYKKISSRLNISYKTLMRQKYLFDDQFTSMSDSELDSFIRKEKIQNPSCGSVYLQGSLLANKYKVTRARVRKRLRIIDPIQTVLHRRVKTKRTVYHAPQPNSLWHWDGNEKLVMFGFYIHGCVDGNSRKIMYLHCAPDKKSPTVFKCFKEAVKNFGHPARARCDKGRENVDIARFMLKRRGLSGCLTGKSTRNTRIERLWREVNKITLYFKNLFFSWVERGILDMDDDVDLYCLQFIFLPRIQSALDKFSLTHNHHRIRTAHNKTPSEMFDTYHKVPNNVFPSSSSDDENEYNDDEFCSDADESFHPNDEMLALAHQCVPNPRDESVDAEVMFLNLKSTLSNDLQ